MPTPRRRPRGELIWGLPGERYEEFLRSYDDLSVHTDALSVYPLYVLPNTQYADELEKHAIRVAHAESDTDYAYCVEHAQMSHDDFLAGLRFIVSNNILKVGGAFLRLYPRAAWAEGIPFHETVGRLGEWLAGTQHPVARRFEKYYADPLHRHRQSLTEVWLAIARDRDGLLDMFLTYVEETFLRGLHGEAAARLRSALRFDAETYPVMDSPRCEATESSEGAYVRTVEFAYDVLSFGNDRRCRPTRGPVQYRIVSPAGLWRYPMGNWYFGLIGYRGRAERVDVATAVS